jgi:MFS transporter, NNP family, nitrate/nitrite transporter
MSAQPAAPAVAKSGTWLSRWEPENNDFWDSVGKRQAWTTLILTTAALTMAFITWFLVSALVVRLPQIGFQFTGSQLFWLAAMPGLAGGTLRLIHMFLVPIYGTRHVISLSTLSLLIPLVGWFYAVQDPDHPLLGPDAAGLPRRSGRRQLLVPSCPRPAMFFPKRHAGHRAGHPGG